MASFSGTPRYVIVSGCLAFTARRYDEAVPILLSASGTRSQAADMLSRSRLALCDGGGRMETVAMGRMQRRNIPPRFARGVKKRANHLS